MFNNLGMKILLIWLVLGLRGLQFKDVCLIFTEKKLFFANFINGFLCSNKISHTVE